jgi:hypothetical protein
MDTAKRPNGIWIVTAWLFLFAGLLPIGLALLSYFRPHGGNHTMSFMGMAGSFAIPAAIVVVAVFAWLGHAWARYSLILLTVVFYGLVAYNLYSVTKKLRIPDDRMQFVWRWMALSLPTAKTNGYKAGG